jgi:hypothetical protein
MIARRLALLVLLASLANQNALANYFPAQSFKAYQMRGAYPLWSKTWVALEPRVHLDASRIPYVEYASGPAYNSVTIALFGLLAYNRFLERHESGDREEFLQMANWLQSHQDQKCGCWYYDFDYPYVTLDETLHKPWISGMAQGLALSVFARAYTLTNDSSYVKAAEKALLPFTKPVEDGGVTRKFSFASSESLENPFYEEYPVGPEPSYTLNGFMFALLGLYDFAQVPDSQAAKLFQAGLGTLEEALPLYDLGDASAYDLGHLTHPPRRINRDDGYHLVHITLLNALGTATHRSELLWYRDHWNSYGTPVGANVIWLRHFAAWLVKRHAFASGTALAVALLVLIAGSFQLRRKRTAPPLAAAEIFQEHYSASRT